MGYRRNNEPKRLWHQWRVRNQAALEEAGLPEVLVEDEEHWWDFLEHGFLDHHDDPAHFRMGHLRRPQMVALHNLLNVELSEEDKKHSQAWLELDSLIGKVQHKYACPCCGYKTLDQEPPGTYDICPICFWEDDGIQFDDPDHAGGANQVSLREGQKNFIEFGACEASALNIVRRPGAQDERDPDWKPR